jgi:hypothetical protein
VSRPCRVEECLAHPGMFRLAWPDGSLSRDCYNKTRAQDILRCYDRYLANMATGARSVKGVAPVQRGPPVSETVTPGVRHRATPKTSPRAL